jgi:hypothetical protein
MLGRYSLFVFACGAAALSATAGTPQESCQLSIRGDGTSTVFISASGCTGDTIGVVAGAQAHQKQFPGGPGPDLDRPFNVNQCDMDVNSDHSVGISYTLIVTSGPDKGQTSSVYSGTLDPDPKPTDRPPTVSLSGVPLPGTFVRSGDAIALRASAGDDYGVTQVKIFGPDGKILLDGHPKPPPPLYTGSTCHPQVVDQHVDLDASKIYTVPSNPHVPAIQFKAWARDTAGQEASSTAEYLTEATWTGMMLLDGSGSVPGNTCTTQWRIALTVKTTAQSEVTGTAEARHPPLACRYAGPRDSNAPMFFAISGTFQDRLFRLYFKPTAGASIAWGIAGLHLLALPSPLPVELTLAPGDREYAKGAVARDNSGNVENKSGTAAIAGSAYLQCCFSEPKPSGPPKTPPIFLGEDGEQMHLGGSQ